MTKYAVLIQNLALARRQGYTTTATLNNGNVVHCTQIAIMSDFAACAKQYPDAVVHELSELRSQGPSISYPPERKRSFRR